MPRFVTIGYGDQAGYERTSAAVRDAAHAHDAALRERGVLMGVAGRPVQVRNHAAAKVEVTEGPFLSSPLPLAGFAVIDAADLKTAIEIASKSPCAVAQGVIEIWPLVVAPEPRTRKGGGAEKRNDPPAGPSEHPNADWLTPHLRPRGGRCYARSFAP